MSRTFRTNKYGEISTDKQPRNFTGCGCVYCDYINKDFRRELTEKYLDNEIKEAILNN